jgi:hypothetical protein
MSIAELSSLGELLGALAVVVTLIFLTLQMRQNTKAVSASMAGDLTNHFITNAGRVVNDPDVAKLIARAHAGDYGEMSGDDKLRVFFFGMLSLKAGDFAHYQWCEGNLDDALWNGTAQTISQSFEDPNHPMALAWEGTRAFCTPDFQEYVESIRMLNAGS